MVNPPAKQVVAFDSGIRNFFHPSLAAKLPISLQPGDTLVSTISLRAGESISFPFGSTRGSREHHDNSPVKSAAILTCVKEPLPADAFRPSYGDRSHKIYYARDLKRHLLPNLKTPAKVPDLAMLLRALERPWVNPCFFGFRAADGEHAALWPIYRSRPINGRLDADARFTGSIQRRHS